MYIPYGFLISGGGKPRKNHALLVALRCMVELVGVGVSQFSGLLQKWYEKIPEVKTFDNIYIRIKDM